jgi:hypothetical protein
MIKVLVVLLLLLFLLAMIATRYRRQIKMGIEVFKAFRKMREGAPNASRIEKREDLSNAPLVKCIKCGTWVPQPKAMKLGRNTYCSAVCVERSELRV